MSRLSFVARRRISLKCFATAGALWLGGCEEQRLTTADCTLIQSRLQAAWERDALGAQTETSEEVFVQFVRDERDRLGSDWMVKCSPLVGREVSPAELSCLRQVDTIDDVYECAR